MPTFHQPTYLEVETMFQLIESEQHDPLVATYQVLELARLNDALKECGIVDSDQRRRICETYFFNSGYFLDSCWFEESEARYRPVICFAEIDSQNRDTGRLLIPEPSAGTLFHEYAHGNASWLFDEHYEDASEIATGDLSP